MEVFSGPNAVRAGCCANASYGVAVYYSNNGSTLDNANFYWLNNFDDIGRSYVTLYEEMVVNNWFIQMEGFVSTTSSAARIYFILFWITTTLVINIAIVYIVDAFESGILALKSGNKEDMEELMKLSRRMMITGLSELRKIVHLILSDDEIDSLHSILKKSTDYNNRCSVNNWIRKRLSIAPRTIKV
jgi:two pore calcium channel protein 1